MTNRKFDVVEFFVFCQRITFLLCCFVARSYHYTWHHGWIAEFDLCFIFYATAKIINSVYVFISIYFLPSRLRFCVSCEIFKCDSFMLDVGWCGVVWKLFFCQIYNTTSTHPPPFRVRHNVHERNNYMQKLLKVGMSKCCCSCWLEKWFVTSVAYMFLNVQKDRWW